MDIFVVDLTLNMYATHIDNTTQVSKQTSQSVNGHQFDL